MSISIEEASTLVDRAGKLVDALEAGSGRAAFIEAGYGEGDHARGQRVRRAAEEALAEARHAPTLALKLHQGGRACAAWWDARLEELKLEALGALAPSRVLRAAQDLFGRLRGIVRGTEAADRLEFAVAELREWLERWLPVARRVARDRPDLAEQYGLAPTLQARRSP
jgi:hypothetical protein